METVDLQTEKDLPLPTNFANDDEVTVGARVIEGEREREGEGEGEACCSCTGSCILLWIGLLIFHLGLFFLLFMVSMPIAVAMLIAYAVTIRLCLFKIESPGLTSVLWILFVVAIGSAGFVLAMIVVPKSEYNPPDYSTPYCTMDRCAQIPSNASPSLQQWCSRNWRYPFYTFIGNEMYFKNDERNAIFAHGESRVRPVRVNGELKVNGRYSQIDSLGDQLVLSSYLYSQQVSPVYALTLNLSNAEVIDAAGPSLSSSRYVESVAVIDGYIYWVTSGNPRPLPETTVYISNGTVEGTMTSLAFYNISNPCDVTPSPSPTPTSSPSRGYHFIFVCILLLSCVPTLITVLVVWRVCQVNAMAFACYVTLMYTLIVIFCVWDSPRLGFEIAFWISYLMFFAVFSLLVRERISRVICGWLLFAVSVCYLVFIPFYFLSSFSEIQIIHYILGISILFVGLMVPSIPVILVALVEMFSFLLWLLKFTIEPSIVAFVLLSVVGLLLVVGVVMLKDVMVSFRRKFYETFGPEDTNREETVYVTYLELDLLKAPLSNKLEIV